MPQSSGFAIPTVRKVLYAGLLFSAVLVGLELAARLAAGAVDGGGEEMVSHPGWQTVFFRSKFSWHEPDPDLLWRFRPNLNNPLIKTNSRGLIAEDIAYRKPPGVFRLLILGDSSPVGLGLNDRSATFPEVLKRQLERSLGAGRAVEVVNAAVSGYSSEQIARFMELEGCRYEPDVVVLYCGNNDASISGPWSDRQLLENQRLRGLRRALAHFALYRVLRDALAPGNSGHSDGRETTLVARVSPARFAENLGRIVQLCRSIRAPLYVVVPPVPRLWPAGLQFRPLRHLTDADGELIFPPELRIILNRDLLYCLSESRLHQLHPALDKFTQLVFLSAAADSVKPDLALSQWRTLAANDPDPVNLNNLGVSLWRTAQFGAADSIFAAARAALKDLPWSAAASDAAGSAILFNRGINALDALGLDTLCDPTVSPAAVACLDSALAADWLSLRIKPPYTAAILALGGQTGVTVIDPGLEFATTGFERLFVDHCHPTEEGHRIIGRALARAILPVILGKGNRPGGPA